MTELGDKLYEEITQDFDLLKIKIATFQEFENNLTIN
jgi:hypothetical protein